jgi:autotransporter-associated beta strand protein
MRIAGINGEAAWRGDILLSSANVVIDSHGDSATAATLAGAKVAYAGGSALTIPADVGSVVIGSAGASASSLRREGRGTLVVRVEKPNGALGTDALLKVNGGVGNDPRTGLVAAPVFAATYDTTVGVYMSNRNWMPISFLRYDAEMGLVAAEPAQGIPENSDGATVANIHSAASTLSADAHVGALSFTAASGSAGPSLTIADGCTLTVGNGAGTIAPVLLNSLCMNSVQSGAKLLGGTVDFGAAEGVVMANQSEFKSGGHLGMSWTTLGSKIKGSGGIVFGSFNSSVQYLCGRQIMVSGDNEYTGGTWIENVSIYVTGATALGEDAVTIDGNETDGGQLVFDSDYGGGDFANDLVLNGNGACVQPTVPFAWSDRAGAVVALAPAKLTGAVLLASDASVSAFGGEGCALEFAGAVSGSGVLTVKGDGVAKTRLSGANTYSGGTEVAAGGWLCVANADALGSGAVTVADEGVLAFDNPQSASCANVIDGANVFVDLAGRTVETAPFVCSRPITNTVASVKAKLRVVGGTSVYTGGDFGGNIQLDILPDATLDLGGRTVEVDYVRGSKRVENGTLVVRVRDLGDFVGMTITIR